MGAQAVRLSNGDIDNALKDKDFEVLFQPIFDLGNGALARVETFVRWRHPTLGVLPPGAFISFFETQGRMSELTRYVLSQALSEYQAWRGPHAPGFSINLALSDLSDESFASHFTVLLREHAFPPELVTLECPMPAVDADVAQVARQLQRLRETGARLAIEVRGRANDFLKSIRPFPFAEIKTGGAAILRFARTVRGPGLSAISELLELAAEQNAAITAVGVEDQASLSALRGLGFAAAQGNHLGKVGALDNFMPSHVNDVRTLLGLETLSSENLVALFRTGAPTLSAAPVESEAAAVADQVDVVTDHLIDEVTGRAAAREPQDPGAGDDLVKRLAARIARAGDPDESQDAEKAREKAKAAAIARAKRNTRAREKIASRNALKEKAEARTESPAPHDMQDRLTREFGDYAQNAPLTEEFKDAPHAPEGVREDPNFFADEETPQAAAPSEPTSPAAAAVKTFDARMAVKGARARFTPAIHVSGPEPILPHELIGDLHREEEPASRIPEPRAQAAVDAASSPVDDAEDAIPEPMASAAWLEETVEIVEARTSTPVRARKNFFTRTVIPFSALKIRHFWPHYIRKRMKRSAKAEAAE